MLYRMLAAMFLFVTPVFAQQEQIAREPTELATVLQEKLDQIVRDDELPGATLSVVLPDGKLISLASGFEDPESQTKMAVDAKMFCGSTGKTFVSAVAIQLIGEGKIQLDDLASKYFVSDDDQDWYQKLPNAQSITIRSLMNHTSGLPRYLFQPSFLEDLKNDPMRSRNPKEGLSLLHGVDPIHAVGEAWSYSDSNYLVLGLIIENVTGETFFELAHKRLLCPLELDGTQPTTQAKLDGLIQGHIGSNNFFDLPNKTIVDGAYVMNPDFEWCGGGFVTNVSDLAKWLHALHSGIVLDPEWHSQLVSAVEFGTAKPGETGYGLGTFVWKSETGLYYGHAGIMPGYLTQIEFSKEHQFAIAFQTNTDEGMGRGLHEHVQSIADLVIEHLK